MLVKFCLAADKKIFVNGFGYNFAAPLIQRHGSDHVTYIN